MTDDFLIQVRVMLPRSVVAKLTAAAEKHETTVGELTAELVRRALTFAAAPQPPTLVARPRDEPTHHRKRITPEGTQRLRELHALGWADNRIAKDLGISQPTTSKARRDLGLPSHFRSPNTRGPQQ